MRRHLPLFIVFAFFIMIFNAPGCAMRSDVWELEDRVENLKEENARLRQNFDEVLGEIEDVLQKDTLQKDDISDDIGEFAATQDAKFYQMRMEIQKLSGIIEELEYKLNRNAGALRNEIAETGVDIRKNTETIESYEKRLSRLETYVGLEVSEKIKDPAANDYPAEEKLEALDEQELYALAKQMFDDKEYERALEGFAIFLERFPDSTLADNARFWTGEVYFAEEWYERAIVEYQRVIDDYPEGNKVPAAYLKQGISFSLLGEKDNAVYILEELITKFPDHSEAKIARSRLEAIDS